MGESRSSLQMQQDSENWLALRSLRGSVASISGKLDVIIGLLRGMQGMAVVTYPAEPQVSGGITPFDSRERPDGPSAREGT